MAKRGFWIGLVSLTLLAGGGYGAAAYHGLVPIPAPLAGMVPAKTETTSPTPRPGGPRPAPVLIGKVSRAEVPIEITAVGSVQPSESVAVRSRIDGAIVQNHFVEGDEVKAGDLLFSLDARAIEAQIRQAEANLARDRITVANARRDAARYQTLAQSDFVARQKLDDSVALVQSTENTVKATEANVEALKVQLSYTRITAPIGGRTGRINLTKGNVVRANDTTSLVVINQIKPVSLLFAVPQRYFPDMRAAIAQGVTVTADAPGKGKVEGSVGFLDNSIDANTGTFQVKASFPNPDGALWPGMFVPVTARLGVEAGVLVVPGQTVQNGQQGSYVYVVKPDNSVELRPITIARSFGEQVVIQSGLKEGETVVIEGQMRLFPGAKVEPRDRRGPPGPGQSQGQGQTQGQNQPQPAAQAAPTQGRAS